MNLDLDFGVENIMARRFRNPRYAPESLERRLSPSTFLAPTSAYVYTDSTMDTTTTTDSTLDPNSSSSSTPDTTLTADPEPAPAPIPGTENPPIEAPKTPIGPAVPA